MCIRDRAETDQTTSTHINEPKAAPTKEHSKEVAPDNEDSLSTKSEKKAAAEEHCKGSEVEADEYLTRYKKRLKTLEQLANTRRKLRSSIEKNSTLIGGKKKPENKLNDKKTSKQKKGSHRVNNSKRFFRYTLTKNSSISVKDLPHKVDDRQEELFRRFLVTWSEVKFDSTKEIFIAKNSDGDTFYIDIDTICRLDEKNLLDASYLEGMRNNTEQQNVFFPLPDEYKKYINNLAKEVGIAHDQIKERWVSVFYDTKSDSYLGRNFYFLQSNKKSKKALPPVPLSHIFVSYLREQSSEYKMAFDAAKTEGNKWTNVPLGVSASGLNEFSPGVRRLMQFKSSTSFRFFSHGSSSTCVFSSLASALSYKGYHEAAKIVSDNIEISVTKTNPIAFVLRLLQNVMIIKKFREKDEFNKKNLFILTKNPIIQFCFNFVSKKVVM